MKKVVVLEVERLLYRSNVAPKAQCVFRLSSPPPIQLNLCHLYCFPVTSVSVRSSIYQFVHSLTHSFTHSFIHSFTHSFIHLFIHSFIYSPIHSFIHSLIHLFIHSFTHSFIHPFIPSFIHSFIYLLIHSFFHLFIHYFFTFPILPSQVLRHMFPVLSQTQRHRHRTGLQTT